MHYNSGSQDKSKVFLPKGVPSGHDLWPKTCTNSPYIRGLSLEKLPRELSAFGKANIKPASSSITVSFLG